MNAPQPVPTIISPVDDHADSRDTTLLEFAPGELIYALDSAPREAYRIVSGRVALMRPNGDEVEVGDSLGAGSLLADSELVALSPRRYNAVAETLTRLQIVDRDTIIARMAEDADYARQLLEQARITPAATAAPSASTSLLPAAEPQISAFNPDYLLLQQHEAPQLLRWTVPVLCAALLSLIAWAAVAKTQTVISGHGKLITDVPTMVVQSFDQALLKEVKVQEGEAVKQGQLLALLDPSVAEADQYSVRQQLTAAQAQMARLGAEQQWQDHPDADAPSFSSDAQEQARQATLYQVRQRQYQASVDSYRNDIAALDSQLQGQKQALRDQQQQLKLTKEFTALKQDQYQREKEAYQRDGVYRLEYLKAAQSLTEVAKDTEATRSAIQSSSKQLAAKQAQLQAFRAQWQAQNESDMSDLQRQLTQLQAQLTKQDRNAGLVALRAPADGIVQSIALQNPGAVIRPAETLFEIVPDKVAQEFEVAISPSDIGQIKVGDPAQIRLDTLPSVRHGILTGTLTYLSADSVKGNNRQTPEEAMYRARIRIDGQKLFDVPPSFALRPGMTATADIQVGERRMISYLFYPVARALHQSFREP
ncbi:hypothetical protein C4K68_20735 [Pokkaliibacter plantistimulans]|uniref:Membrane fusion protein (MFP) family protein n=1 Tax=Proteobacteria bacterium 228 TaxID=2083153 RepID=A0A2S5KL81_9PROT|nr:HlyD family type I secretion periplasmic adaptor subunit [Pokkaliibacter plantistimulans]PPC75395.1 hypothetical protein C4K68_20735 [Pokkaliibacter plantistimulans]